MLFLLLSRNYVDMKRKLKIAGLSALLVSIFSVVINSAVSGGIGFGILIIVLFFLSAFSLIGTFFISLFSYRLLKKSFKPEKNLNDSGCEVSK